MYRCWPAVVVLLGSTPALAAEVSSTVEIGVDHPLGVGVTAGKPAGLTAKVWLSDELSANIVLGGFLQRAPLLLSADIAYHLRNIASAEEFELNVYGAIGLGLGLWRRTQGHAHDEPFPHRHSHSLSKLFTYLRGIGGAAALMRTLPLELFVEIGPAFRITPSDNDGRSSISGAVGARYYFQGGS